MRRSAKVAVCAAVALLMTGCAETDRTTLLAKKSGDSQLASASVGGGGGGLFGFGAPTAPGGNAGGSPGGERGVPSGAPSPTPFSNPNDAASGRGTTPGGPAGAVPGSALPGGASASGAVPMPTPGAPPGGAQLPAFKNTAYCQSVKSATNSLSSMSSMKPNSSDPFSAMRQFGDLFKNVADSWQKAADLAPVDMRSDTQTIASVYRDVADNMLRGNFQALQGMGGSMTSVTGQYQKVLQYCATPG